ncbi:MAG: hypothetical protein IPM29_31135 [Planctomycetes bacterium]|nr:hypothetical protein [Planctomycetota bacterium]
MIDLIIATAVAAIAAVGFLAAMTNGQRLQKQTATYADASRVIAEVHALLRSGDLDARVAEFKASPTLTVNAVVAEVRFPAQLVAELLGAPIPAGWRYRDLDADGEVDLDTAASATASLVPVTVTARWTGGTATSSFFLTEP